MNRADVTIIDYGMGNIWSVKNAINYLGYTSLICSDPHEIIHANSLILPGVGSFRRAVNSIKARGLGEAIIESVQVRGVNILGICLGMQLLGLSSSEDGDAYGLGLIPSQVDKFNMGRQIGLKIPHVGFDTVYSSKDSKLFNGLGDGSDFYFVHSYRMLPENLNGKIATCNYGVEFLAAYERENIFATQFHPEKSQTNGLIVLHNFLAQ